MNKAIILKELNFKAVRSSGAGGQHVNKVSSKVELYFDLMDSEGLSNREKSILTKNLKPKLTSEGVLILYAQDSRSQHRNKELVINKLFKLLKSNSKPPKKRIQTAVPNSVKRKRKDNKKRQSEKKESRRKLRW